jgi:glycerol uptake facilitator-like aquaporin
VLGTFVLVLFINPARAFGPLLVGEFGPFDRSSGSSSAR